MHPHGGWHRSASRAVVRLQHGSLGGVPVLLGDRGHALVAGAAGVVVAVVEDLAVGAKRLMAQNCLFTTSARKHHKMIYTKLSVNMEMSPTPSTPVEVLLSSPTLLQMRHRLPLLP